MVTANPNDGEGYKAFKLKKVVDIVSILWSIVPCSDYSLDNMIQVKTLDGQVISPISYPAVVCFFNKGEHSEL